MHSGLDQFLEAGAGGSSFHHGWNIARLKPQCANACGYLFAARIMPCCEHALDEAPQLCILRIRLKVPKYCGAWAPGETALARGWGLMAPEPSPSCAPIRERRIFVPGQNGKTVRGRSR
jgi:hypothetical protein